MMTTRQFVILAAAFALPLGAASAQAQAKAQKKEIAGLWSLRVGESTMPGDAPADNYQYTKAIHLAGRRVSITNTIKGATMANIPLPDAISTLTFTAGGKEQDTQYPPLFPGMPTLPARIGASWEGCSLTIHEYTVGTANSEKQRLFLSEDGQRLIVLIERHTTFFDNEQRLVFARAKLSTVSAR